ncbi:MAG: FAD-binding oxidoreductase [Sphingomonadaceae bacterium]|nr:FAD-binding oxidoreductase [Sphingomonadaceae bacterium]
MASTAAIDSDILATLETIVGRQYLRTDKGERQFYGTDVFRAGQLPAAVILPGSIDELQNIIRIAARHAIPLTVRGGGASYTDGYTHAAPGGFTIGTDRLVAIDIDEAKSVVTVEAGVTWAQLYESLKDKGLRTPFWGPFSGLAATVAGSVSQNAISHGGGVSADSVLTMDIVTGTGELLQTGSSGSTVPSPFFRHYGPDLAGLFTGDCGTLGIKARITLKLIARHTAFDALSFSFPNFAAMHLAMAEIAVLGIDDENFGLDAALQQGQIGRNEGASAKAGIARHVLKSSASFGAGMKTLAKMAIAGDRALKSADYAVHYLTDGVSDIDAKEKGAAIRAVASRYGTEIANSVPIVVRAMPFAPLANMLGPKGERWVPMHGLFAHDAVVPFHNALDAFWEERRAEMDRHSIYTGAMFMAVGSAGFVYEPAFYWPDARHIVHERMMPAEHLASLPDHPPAPEASDLVVQLRRQITELMMQFGAAHLQIGKVYPYLTGRNAASVALLRAIKTELDPKNILNPGALGL